MEDIFEPRPSTSTENTTPSPEEDNFRQTGKFDLAGFRSNTVATTTPRGSLNLQPRTSQYEKHPLLQARSPSGKSELEELTEALLLKQQSMDLCDEDIPMLTKSNSLVPRSAFAENTALFTRNKETGLTELEMYLNERHQEMKGSDKNLAQKRAMSLPASVCTPDDGRPLIVNNSQKLIPRSTQYEKSNLLQEKDEYGMSAIDYFLSEKTQLLMDMDQDNESNSSKGKCSETAKCKSAQCTICKPQNSPHLKSPAEGTITSTGVSPDITTEETHDTNNISPKDPNQQSDKKTVHFAQYARCQVSKEKAEDVDDTIPVPKGRKPWLLRVFTKGGQRYKAEEDVSSPPPTPNADTVTPRADETEALVGSPSKSKDKSHKAKCFII